MNVRDFVLRSERVVLPGGVRPAAVLVRDGRIAAVGDGHERHAGAREIDVGRLVVLPGLVDSHVHVNDPGRDTWEGFEHATRAAAAGGVTTLVDMPLNSIPATTDVDGFHAKARAAAGRCHVDVGLWGGVVPGNAGALAPLARAGVLGFKCFLSPSGVDEFPHVAERDLREALPVLARLRRPLLVHAEMPPHLQAIDPGADVRDYRTWLDSRPPAAEEAAIALLIALSREFDAHIHVVHVASGGAVAMIARARQEGLRITAETCPHYLSFAAEDVPRGATPFKCAPPIRDRSHRERLWWALGEGILDLVATDHSPAPPGLKCVEAGDFVRAWGGIASLQIGLSAVWTAAAARGFGVERIARWMSAGPAALAGLDRTKGRIEPGKDADLVVWDPEAEVSVDGGALEHRHPLTPYQGLHLRGRVRTTILRGEVVFADGRFAAPRGTLLTAPTS